MEPNAQPPAQEPAASQPAPQPAPAPSPVPPPAPVSPTPPEQPASAQAPQPTPDPDASFSWEASEFVHHDKKASWYLGLWVVTLALSGVLVWLQQWLGIAVLVAMALAVTVYSRKQPRTLPYTIDAQGIAIGDKLAPYANFRSFNVIEEVGWHELELEPAKRFVPRLTLIADDESFQQIADILVQHLPRHDRELDWIEKLTRALKF